MWSFEVGIDVLKKQAGQEAGNGNPNRKKKISDTENTRIGDIDGDIQ